MAGAVAKRLFDSAFNDELLTQIESNANTKDWTAAGRNRSKANPAGEDGAWWRTHGPDMVQSWIDWRYDSGWTVWTTPDGQPAIELELIVDCLIDPTNAKSCECDDCVIPVKMIIDRVMVTPHKQLCILDLKSGARTPDSDLQLAFYRYGIFKQYGVDVRLACYWMARKGETTEPHDLGHYEPELMEQWFRTFKRATNEGIFLPHPSSKCRACGVRDYCAAFGGVRSEFALARGEQVERGLQATGQPEIRAGSSGDAECAGRNDPGT